MSNVYLQIMSFAAVACVEQFVGAFQFNLDAMPRDSEVAMEAVSELPQTGSKLFNSSLLDLEKPHPKEYNKKVADKMLHLHDVRDTPPVGSRAQQDSCQPGFQPPSNTNCPRAAWVDAMVRADPAPGKVILNVGCNKGNDAISWMERWDMSKERVWSARKWLDKVRPKTEHFVCEPEIPRSTAFANTHAHTEANTQQPVSVCVEPMRANLKLLKETSDELGYTHNKHGRFVIVKAVVTDYAHAHGTITFPDGELGAESLGVPVSTMDSTMDSDVPLKTVDSIAHEAGLSTVDILSIDTEGSDPNVLLGAEKTLASVRYLEFEVHRDLKGTAWHNTTLKKVLMRLSTKNFDCYWAGNNGKLVSMSDCWQDSYETGGWANAACVKRNDVWSHVLKTFTVPDATKNLAKKAATAVTHEG